MTSDQIPVKDKIAKARVGLVLDHPFFGCLALQLPMEPTLQHEHAATDGKSLMYNPEWIQTLSMEETQGVLARGVLKAALGHCWRVGERDLNKWQTASDHAVDYTLTESGFELLHQRMSMYDDMAVEDIYAHLPESNKDQQGPQGQSGQGQSDPNGQPDPDAQGDPDQQGQDQEDQQQPGPCDVIPIEDKKAGKEMEAKWRAAISQAKSAARGEVPGGMGRLIEEVMAPGLPWHVLLREFLEQTARNDFNWSRPSRRWLPLDIIMPSLVSDELSGIVVFDDTSGSITQEQINAHGAELSHILDSFDTEVRVVWIDSKVQGEQVFTRHDMPLNLQPKGGGGTDFRPGFKYVEEKQYNPRVCIFFTDLDGDFPEIPPDYPVVWVAPRNSREDAPFGTTLRY